MISFETPQAIEERLAFVREVARGVMRENARRYDEHEHEIPWDFVNLMWETALRTGQSFRSGAPRHGDGPSLAAQALVHVIEMQSWGDAGIYLCCPGAGLGFAAVEATGTAERQAWIADLANAGVFGERDAPDFARSANWRREADRLLASLKEAT